MKNHEPVLTASAMRSADAFTIDDFGISGFTLMESAGRGTALRIDACCGPVDGQRINVYCGKGNNGGDGFVVARYLFDRGAILRVITVGDPDAMSGDAASQFRLLQKLNDRDPEDRLTLAHYEGTSPIPAADIHVDALLGTGLTSDLREPILSLVRSINGMAGMKVAVDVPTGLHTDLGRPLGDAFRAYFTFTMGARKTGHCLNEGKDLCGRVEVIDIGIPHFALHEPVETGRSGCAWLATDDAVRSWLPERSHDANKYSVGLALVIAGSAGMTGAPVMAATSAARAGAGYVVCACDERIESVLSVKLTEVTTIPLPASVAGLDPDGAMQAVGGRLDKAAAGLIGCGLGRAKDTQEFVRSFLSDVDLPMVVDADGLNALAGHTDLISRRADGRWILTPHMGEFRRLAGEELEETGLDADDRLGLAQHFARAWNCVLLLKGLPSIVASPHGTAWINATGNAGLAAAGTGDVLAGLCAGLLAQGMAPVHAAVAALHIGGAAADRFAEHRAARSMQAMDLADQVPYVMKQRFSDLKAH